MLPKDKVNDSSDFKLTVLKNPIPLDSLKCEDEASPIKADKTMKRNDIETHNTKKIETKTITFLKEPIELDKLNFEGLSSLTLNVKTVERSVKVCSKSKRREKQQHWMSNAVTLFELSYVYPFVYAKNKFKCFVCMETFLDAKILKQHTINHNLKEIRQKIYNTANNVNVKVDVTYLQCRICDKSFNSLQELKTHLTVHGKGFCDAQDNLIPFRLGRVPFQCQICREDFDKLRPLIIHMSKHFNNFSCEICGSVFLTMKSLNSHLHTHETGTFPCEKCDKVFSNASKKSLHIRGVHLKQYPRRCPICPERFNSDYMRTKHLRIVHNRTAGLNKCVVCGKEYDLKYQLQMHVRSVHYQEKNQECPDCHARFFSKYLLSRHMLIHTGIRNFKCDVCGKTYVRKAHLKQHSRSHHAE